MKPCILLVEDDPTSAAFLAAAIEGLPADVDVATTRADAIAAAGARTHALWLIDANLPDGSGIALLAQLRASGGLAPAIAHTATQDRDVLDALLVAGFVQVLVKPLPAAQLQRALASALAGASRVAELEVPVALEGVLPVWDDAVAARALKGGTGNVGALRGLCLGELPHALKAITDALARHDLEGVQHTLHRLRASCGFVGATRLDAAVRELQAQPLSRAAQARFEAALQDTLIAG